MTAEKNSIYFESFKNLFNEFYSLIDTDMKNCRYDIISVEQIKQKCIKIFLKTIYIIHKYCI